MLKPKSESEAAYAPKTKSQSGKNRIKNWIRYWTKKLTVGFRPSMKSVDCGKYASRPEKNMNSKMLRENTLMKSLNSNFVAAGFSIWLALYGSFC